MGPQKRKIKDTKNKGIGICVTFLYGTTNGQARGPARLIHGPAHVCFAGRPVWSPALLGLAVNVMGQAGPRPILLQLDGVGPTGPFGLPASANDKPCFFLPVFFHCS